MNSGDTNGDGRFVTIGRITGAHGIHGALKIHSYAKSLDLFMVEEGVHLQFSGGRSQQATVTAVKPHGRRLLMTLEGVSDRNQAEKLAGVLICTERSHLPDLETDTYYWADLLGCDVYTVADRYLGQVDSIIATGGNDVLVVKRPDGDARQEILIPAVADVCRSVDLAGRRLTVDLPEGLYPEDRTGPKTERTQK